MSIACSAQLAIVAREHRGAKRARRHIDSAKRRSKHVEPREVGLIQAHVLELRALHRRLTKLAVVHRQMVDGRLGEIGVGEVRGAHAHLREPRLEEAQPQRGAIS